MALVVLIETPGKLDGYIEQDMRRWWRNHCRKHTTLNGEIFFIVPGKFNLYEGVKRLASFGVKARVARREYISSPTYL
jgi:hypothetical protein